VNPTVQRFDRAAKTYDAHSQVQQELGDSLLALFRRSASPKRILEMGCGTGQFSVKLRQKFPNSQLWITDASPRMLAFAKNKLQTTVALESAQEEDSSEFRDLMHFETLDASQPKWGSEQPGPPFDMVASNALVQWFPDLGRHLAATSELLRSGGDILVSGFLDDNLPELRTLLDPSGVNQHHHVGHSAEVVQKAVDDTGLVLKAWQGWDEKIVYPDAASMLQTLSRLGATGGPSQAPLSRAQLRDLCARYSRRYPHAQGVYATWSAWSAWLIKR
jgi:malonyl-CoA O-methyltransferase